MQIDLYVNDQHNSLLLEQYDTLAFDMELDNLLEDIRNKINHAGSRDLDVKIYIEEEEE